MQKEDRVTCSFPRQGSRLTWLNCIPKSDPVDESSAVERKESVGQIERVASQAQKNWLGLR
ncbi:MAG TPA: hypothetical protein DCY03_16355 [Planctomycetaceae bacterium]|nr:hypothetical protein [Planctomycetaceae bacterium]